MFTDQELAERILKDPDLRRSITLDIGKFTIAMFSLERDVNAKAAFAGTGTLVTNKGKHYILTALHVWHEALKHRSKIGLTLEPDITHNYKIDTASVKTVSDLKADAWNEWGPDLILLELAAENVSDIFAHKTFYDEDIDGKPAPNEFGGVELRCLIGTPAELGTFEPLHADLVICNFFVNVNAPFTTHGKYDFIDFEFNVNAPGNPKDYGGISGGGLWDIALYSTSQTKTGLNWSRTLKGVAFWQQAMSGSHRSVRCHGPKTLSFVRGGVE